MRASSIEIDARPSDAIAVAVTCRPAAADLCERGRIERRAGGVGWDWPAQNVTGLWVVVYSGFVPRQLL